MNTQTTRAEETDNDITINEIINRKMTKFQEENAIHQRELENVFKQEIGQALDKKIKYISVIVAKQVAMQLVDVFKQHIAQVHYTEENLLSGDSSMITQESASLQLKGSQITARNTQV